MSGGFEPKELPDPAAESHAGEHWSLVTRRTASFGEVLWDQGKTRILPSLIPEDVICRLSNYLDYFSSSVCRNLINLMCLELFPVQTISED